MRQPGAEGVAVIGPIRDQAGQGAPVQALARARAWMLSWSTRIPTATLYARLKAPYGDWAQASLTAKETKIFFGQVRHTVGNQKYKHSLTDRARNVQINTHTA